MNHGETTQPTLSSEALAQRLVELCQERRGEDISVLDVRELVDYMDYMVIVTARSERQNRAIAEHAIRSLKAEGVLPLSRAGIDGGAWICLDFVDVVVHGFMPDTRAHYDLELLWADAKRLPVKARPPVEAPAPTTDR